MMASTRQAPVARKIQVTIFRLICVTPNFNAALEGALASLNNQTPKAPPTDSLVLITMAMLNSQRWIYRWQVTVNPGVIDVSRASSISHHFLSGTNMPASLSASIQYTVFGGMLIIYLH